MKVLLDACVLYPTVMRAVVLGVAEQGLFKPFWSARILEEWARAARKIGPLGEPQARAEIALLRVAWPNAEIAPQPGLERRLYLPDPDDVHVLASAIAASADVLLTLNAADFPQQTLRHEGVERRDPDGFLWQIFSDHPDKVQQSVQKVHDEANRLSGQDWDLRKLLKKARLPRLAKALTL